MENTNNHQLPVIPNNQNGNLVVSGVSSSQKMDIKTKEELINEKLKQGFIRVKITLQYLVDKSIKTISKKILVPPNQTLLQIQQSIKNSLYRILTERGITISSSDALFLFIKNNKIAELKLTVKEMTNYMVDGPDGKQLQITGATIQSFGGF